MSDESTIDDSIRVLILAFSQIARAARMNANAPICEAKRVVELAKACWQAEDFKIGIADCDAWLRMHASIEKCKGCDGKKKFRNEISYGGCNGEHWGDCTRECLPYARTEWVLCKDCGGTGKNERVTDAFGP